jgi:transcriptional regulator with XRE-family HTH domain
MRHLDTPESPSSRAPTAMTYELPVNGPQTFGARLRAHREQRQISIASIAESTKILGALLEGLERGDVSRWPSNGFYRRSFIRAYAVAVGLPPEPLVREFVEHYPDLDAAPALPVLVSVSPRQTPRPVLRLTLADSASPFSPARLIRELPRRASAVAFDLFVLGVIGLSLFLALDMFWAPMAIVASCYSFGSTLLLGRTPGSCLFATASRSSAGMWEHARRGLSSVLPRAPQWAEAAPPAQPEHTQA